MLITSYIDYIYCKGVPKLASIIKGSIFGSVKTD